MGLLVLASACVDRTAAMEDGDGDGGSTGGEVESSSDGPGASDETGLDGRATTDDAVDSSDDGEPGSTGEVSACGDPWDLYDGLPCEAEDVGLECPFGDFCAYGYYACEDGSWRFHTTHGCGAEPAPCDENTEPTMGCVGDETCDLDGDCLDVLECEGGNWVEREVCDEIACPSANPGEGLACDDQGWWCTVEVGCGVERLFVCTGEGYWRDPLGDQPVCEMPMSCDWGPLPGDACPIEMEICFFDDPDVPSLLCTDGIWE